MQSRNTIFRLHQMDLKVMGIKFTLILVFILLTGMSQAHAHDLLVLQSDRVKAYDEVVRGFRGACDCSVETMVISEFAGGDLLKTIKRRNPKVVLAIGVDALSRLEKLRDIPVIYAMVLHPAPLVEGKRNVTGVSMFLAPDRQLAMIKKLFPQIGKVGLVHDPVKTASLARKAREAASGLGLSIVARTARSAKETPAMLNQLKGQIDCLWLVPDMALNSAEVVEYVSLFSLENHIPVIAFSDSYLRRGASLSISIDPLDIGRQAGEMARRILAGETIDSIAPVDARKAVTAINAKAVRQLGLLVKYDAVENLVIYEW